MGIGPFASPVSDEKQAEIKGTALGSAKSLFFQWGVAAMACCFSRAHRGRAEDVYVAVYKSLCYSIGEAYQEGVRGAARRMAATGTTGKPHACSYVFLFSVFPLCNVPRLFIDACLHRLQKGSFKKPLKTGYLVKQGAIRKNWLRRFFVVRPDYKIDYYESEEVRFLRLTCWSSLFHC